MNYVLCCVYVAILFKYIDIFYSYGYHAGFHLYLYVISVGVVWMLGPVWLVIVVSSNLINMRCVLCKFSMGLIYIVEHFLPKGLIPNSLRKSWRIKVWTIIIFWGHNLWLLNSYVKNILKTSKEVSTWLIRIYTRCKTLPIVYT